MIRLRSVVMIRLRSIVMTRLRSVIMIRFRLVVMIRSRHKVMTTSVNWQQVVQCWTTLDSCIAPQFGPGLTTLYNTYIYYRLLWVVGQHCLILNILARFFQIHRTVSL